MKKVFQTVYGLFRKSRDNISRSLDEKESDKAAEEFIKKSAEIKEELQKKIEKTNQELQERFNKDKKENSKKSTTKKKTSNTKKKTPVKKIKDSSKKETKKKTVSNKKSTTNKNTKSTTKKTAGKTKSYPSGLIVNSKILSSVERGYLELAGFKNYKDTLINLETASKRNTIAKKVTTTSGVLNTIVKKIEMLQLKGVSEKTAIALIEIGITNTSKLEKSNVETIIKKVEKYKKNNPKSEISLGKKQIENLISNSKK